MVACDHQLELRHVLEEVLAHETRRHLVATGDGLDLGFVPAPTLFGFDGGHKAGTAQARQIGRMPVGARLHERVHRRVGRVVAQDGGQDVDEHRLAVRAGPVQEEQRVLAGHARQAVADHQLQIGNQFGVAACDIGQECAPRRTVALRCGRGHLGHPIIAPVRSHAARAQINHTAWCVERPDVGIPLLGGGRVLGIGACDFLDGRDRGGAGQLACEPRAVRLE